MSTASPESEDRQALFRADTGQIVRARSPLRIRSVDLSFMVDYGLEELPASNGALDLAKAVIARVGLERGVDIDIRSDAPAGSGLGGPSALTCALLGPLPSLGA